jgi:chromate transporter
MNKYVKLFTSFFKIGLFTFGGGIAMLPLIEKETVEKHKWIDGDEMLKIIAIAESTPGPIAINSATYIGNKIGGFFGALCATLGVALPSFMVIVAITLVLEDFLKNQVVAWAFMGIRSGVAILILNAVIKLSKHCPKTIYSLLIVVATFLVAVLFTNISTIYIILSGMVLGIIYFSVLEKINRKGESK